MQDLQKVIIYKTCILVVSFIFETLLVCFINVFQVMATVQEVITQKLNKEFEVGKNFCYTRVNELVLNKNACKTDVHQ